MLLIKKRARGLLIQ